VKRRDAHIILVSAAAVGGGVAGALLPVDLLEWASQASGLSALVAAAAPPLGETARLGFAGLAGAASAGGAALLSPWKRPRARRTTEEPHMSFMASKFAGFFRRGGKQPALAEAGTETEVAEPVLELAPFVRRADAHPDAPPRAPLVVSRDLGGETAPLMEEEPRGPIIEDITGLAMPRVPEPLPWEEIETEMNRLLGGTQFRSREEETVEPEAASPAEPTLQELTDRLARGMARRRGLATGPTEGMAEAAEAEAEAEAKAGAVDAVASPTLRPDTDTQDPHEPEVQASPDLDAALAALRNITARAS
jgi:hypothetical protein